jgi:hypothetical protein
MAYVSDGVKLAIHSTGSIVIQPRGDARPWQGQSRPWP